jgi:hypothetical protein
VIGGADYGRRSLPTPAVQILAGTVPINKEKVLKAIRHGMGTPVLQKFSANLS